MLGGRQVKAPRKIKTNARTEFFSAGKSKPRPRNVAPTAAEGLEPLSFGCEIPYGALTSGLKNKIPNTVIVREWEVSVI